MGASGRPPALRLSCCWRCWGSPRPARAEAPWSLATADNSFGADRASFVYTLNPGGQLNDGVLVVNNGSAPLDLTLSAADGFTNRAGKLGLVAKDSKGVGVWVRPDQDDVTVPPGQSVEVPLTLTLPKEAAPGDYAGGIVAADGRQQVSLPIRLRVGGALKPGLAVEDVHVDFSGSANPVGDGSATVSYTVHNTGNAIVAAHQALSVSGPFGSFKVAGGKIPDTPALLPGDALEGLRPGAGRGARAAHDGDRHARPAAPGRGGLDRPASRGEDLGPRVDDPVVGARGDPRARSALPSPPCGCGRAGASALRVST